MSSKEQVEGKLSNLKIFEATVVDVDPNTGNISITTSDSAELTDPDIIPPVYYGGVSGAGLFLHPERGDTIICSRVYPGGKGVTQGLRVIPKSTRVADADGVIRSESGDIKAGTPEYPTSGLEPGEVKLRGFGGKVDIVGTGNRGSGISIGTISGDGLHVKSNSTVNSSASLVSNSLKIANDAVRMSSRNVYRYFEGDPELLNKVSANSYIEFQDIDGGKRRGLFPGREASPSAILGGVRNPGLSEYRFVANEFSETEFFSGWDKESAKRDGKTIEKFGSKKLSDSLSFESSLHMAPHQLVEVIIGNVVNSRGEVLDPNYNVVVLGNANGLPIGQGSKKVIYEDARLKSRRGIGYHFQLSTNTLSSEVSNNKDNFIFSVDKEGVLKASVPSSSGTGNVMYPASASFYSENTGKTQTEYSFERKKEKIPITLRASGDVYYPQTDILGDDEVPERFTGIRFSNDNGYFRGFTNTSAEQENIRVNPTKYHNMYAAAEMLIANKVQKVNIPLTSSECTGYIPGTPVGKSFEIVPNSVKGKDDFPKYMSTVTIIPDKPAISTGGGVIVAGIDYEDDIKFANSFALTESGTGVSATNTDDSGEERGNPGGKSANINLEGSLELSVGSDNYDQKSILLDTAGSMVAWFGKDKNNRSLVVQTDGEVLMNVGGNDGNDFNKGRFDLRVNVSDKGFVGEEEDGSDDSDFLISISEAGLVIAGMKKGAPMIIRNDGNLMIESGSKLILSGPKVSIREGARPERPTNLDGVQADTPDASIDGVAGQVSCLAENLGGDS